MPRIAKIETNEQEQTVTELQEIFEIGGYVTTQQAANMLEGKTISNVNYLVRNGTLKAVKISGIILVDKLSVEAYAPTIKENEQGKIENKIKREIATVMRDEKKQLEIQRKAQLEKELRSKYGLS